MRGPPWRVVFARDAGGEQRERLGLLDKRFELVKKRKALRAGRKTMPGLVQNWPAPRVKEPKRLWASAAGPLRSAPGRMKTGLPLDISVKQGMGSGRAAARSMSARPARSEPVKATARMSGCLTSAAPISKPESKSMEKTPGCRSRRRRTR